jgi:SAM-dependent methyltransferase
MTVNTAVPAEERQPTRRAVQENSRRFDQTFLDPNSEIVHRDYAAHFFRWGFAKDRWIVKGVTNVLDVGCGPDRPMLLALFGGIGAHYPNSYVGVDLSKVKQTRHSRSTLYGEFNFIERYKELVATHGQFQLITNFEVIEHMVASDGLKLLRAMGACLAEPDVSHPEGGVLLLSTPVYDGKARAKNHIHEYTVDELQTLLEQAGFRVLQRYGTFMNAFDVRKDATPAQLEVYNQLKAYYSNDVLSTFLAPLHPDRSRNNLWVCGLRRHDPEEQAKAVARAEKGSRGKGRK